MEFCNKLSFFNGFLGFCVILPFVVFSQNKATTLTVKNAPDSIDVYHAAFAQKCPRMARQALDDFKRSPVRNKHQIISTYENQYLEEFEPVKFFLNTPTNSGAYITAFSFAMGNRDYELARTIVDKIPETELIANPGLKSLLLKSIDVTEQKEAGSVLFSNRMVKVFATFPSLASSFTNPPNTFRVEWEEQLHFKNKLHLLSVPSGRRVQSLDNLADAKVCWSTSGRYLAVQWRTFQRLCQSEVLKQVRTESAHAPDPIISLPENKYKFSIIDTLLPGEPLQLEGFLPEKARQSIRMTYWIREWKDDETVSILASWDEDLKPVNTLFLVTLEGNGRLRVSIEK